MIGSSELALAGDSGRSCSRMIWAMALVLVAAGGAVAAVRWSPWPVTS